MENLKIFNNEMKNVKLQKAKRFASALFLAGALVTLNPATASALTRVDSNVNVNYDTLETVQLVKTTDGIEQGSIVLTEEEIDELFSTDSNEITIERDGIVYSFSKDHLLDEIDHAIEVNASKDSEVYINLLLDGITVSNDEGNTSIKLSVDEAEELLNSANSEYVTVEKDGNQVIIDREKLQEKTEAAKAAPLELGLLLLGSGALVGAVAGPEIYINVSDYLEHRKEKKKREQNMLYSTKR